MRFTKIVIAVLLIGFSSSAVSRAEVVKLDSVPNVDWYHGCSPTSAGMVLGYYDRVGYGNNRYDNLVKGEAELNTFGLGGQCNINDAIASSGHINDYFSYIDDYSGRPYDCLADFMGTSKYPLSHGWTRWFYDYDGDRYTVEEIRGYGSNGYSGLVGIADYVSYCGYSLDEQNSYNQIVDSAVAEGCSGGFTFEDYMAEIDAGRPMMVHTDGHSMVGVGYDDETRQIFLHNTWFYEQEAACWMDWGGSYAGASLEAITVLILEPTAVPEPSVLALVLLFAFYSCFRKAKLGLKKLKL